MQVKIIDVYIENQEAYEDLLSRFSPDKASSEAKRVMQITLKAAAERVLTKMSGTLRRGHAYKVGASEASAENLFVGEGPMQGKSSASASIFEGTKTIANAIIRQGLSPGTWPPTGVIRKWAADKGIGSRYKNKQNYATVQGYQRKSGVSVRGYTRRTKGKVNDMFALQWAIREWGTKRKKGQPSPDSWGSDWMHFTPRLAGRGRFDYVAWAIRSRWLTDAMADALNNAATLYVAYLQSGRKQTGEMTYERNISNPGQ